MIPRPPFFILHVTLFVLKNWVLTQPPKCDTVRIMVSIDNVYETTEAAQKLQIGYATIYRWIKKGKIIPIRIAGRTLVPKSEVDRILREQIKTASK